MPTMMKQYDPSSAGGAGGGRTQITAIPTGATTAGRTVSNTSITVTRPVQQGSAAAAAAYLPRTGVASGAGTATQMSGNLATAGQRLVTPIRATPTSVTAGGGGGSTVTGLTASGNFVRSSAASTVGKGGNSSGGAAAGSASPSTTVISPATSTTWVAANTTGQVQLIRAISHPTRQRIITAQGVATAATSGAPTVVATTTPGVASLGQTAQGAASIQAVASQSTVVGSQSHPAGQQPTYVAALATMLPQRQHAATLVYSSNVPAAITQPLAQQSAQQQQQQQTSQQQYQPTTVSTGGQRFAVATPLTAAATSGSTGAAPRQIRPIPLAKPFSAKLNTTSISIRAPNLPQLTPTLGTVSSVATINSPRSTTVTTVTGTGAASAGGGAATSTSVVGVGGNMIPTTNLSTTRIIQLQQPGGGTQQIIGSGRLTGNVMPIIVNASSASKFVAGFRPPVTMATKVQPSLTITQLGIGKLATGGGTSSGGGSVTTSIGGGGGGQQNITAASIQSIGGATNASPATTAATMQSTGAQIVNVSQSAGSQLLSAQNIVSSAGGATVVPLAISTRGTGATGGILTGTITPIKSANAIAVGKVMAAAQQQQQQQQAQAADASSGGAANSGNQNNNAAVSAAGPAVSATNVYIQQRSQPVGGSSGGGGGTAATVTVVNSNGTPTSNSVNTVLTSTGAANAAGGFIYYESVPASTVQVSTGVLSLTTTTTVSSSTTVTPQSAAAGIVAASGNNLTISSLPSFVAAHAAAAANSSPSGGTTFAVVPAQSGTRSIGQLQIPVSSGGQGGPTVSLGGTQIQAVPVRFSQQLASTAAVDAIAVSQASAQLVQATISSTGQQILIPAGGGGHQVQGAGGANAAAASGGQPMVIPLQTSIKVTSGGGSSGTAVVSNILRKRDTDGSPIRAAKNLGPTLLSMGGATSNASASGQSPLANTFTATTTAPQNQTQQQQQSGAGSGVTSLLTVDTLAHKDREEMAADQQQQHQHHSLRRRDDSPMSTDGSRTLSVNSSPGVDQQMYDGGQPMLNDTMHFNPINEDGHAFQMYPHHSASTTVMMHHGGGAQASGGGGAPGAAGGASGPASGSSGGGGGASGTPASSRTSSIDQQLQQRVNGRPSSFHNFPRKKSRRSTNDSQLSSHSQALGVVPPPSDVIVSCCADGMVCANNGLLMANYEGTPCIGNNMTVKTAGNKENTKPVEYVIRRPRICTLLNTYNPTWKAAMNHFQRYTDVKPRDERKPNIMDLANQANILAKINGWKVYHLKSQMEDLCENETSSRDDLAKMLKEVESQDNPEMERISDLIKGNMQRSKVIVDGVNEAQNQLMKIFDHKPHVADIITRCASKRNFKKREKL